MCDVQGVDEQVLVMKADMKQTLDHIGRDNAGSCFELLTSQFNVIERLYEIEKLKGELGIQSLPMTELPAQDVSECSVSADSIGVTTDAPVATDSLLGEPLPLPERKMYRVERKLKGAFVGDIEGFIPESLIRQMDIEHGDYVYAEPVPAVKEGQNRFHYAFAKKSDTSLESGRVEYKGCPVKKDGQLLVVSHSSTTGARIKVDDVPYSIVLSDRDILQFSLVEGDVVDVAFYASKPTSATVVWKHEVSDLPQVEKTEQKKSAYRKDDTESVEVEIEQVFNGQTICVVGDKPDEAIYKKLIEDRGGKHLHVEPKWGTTRIQTYVKKSDVVVGLYDVSGHTGLEKTKEYCKRYGVPFKMISGTGKSKVIQTAVDLLSVPV